MYLTNVAKTVNTNACVERSGITSGSSKTFDSFDTDDREPRSWKMILNNNENHVIHCFYLYAIMLGILTICKINNILTIILMVPNDR